MSVATLNLADQRFGRLVALEPTNRRCSASIMWHCVCDCGGHLLVKSASLVTGKTQSCGCLQKELLGKRMRGLCGPKHPKWKGGRRIDNGYTQIRQQNHPNAVHGYVLEHRLVMEEALRRFLTTNEVIHHKNGIKDDNRLKNLELWVGSHPKGQRVEDLVLWAKELLQKYEPSCLA